MHAIGFDTYGAPQVLHPVNLPDPTPGAGEVLVRVAAAGVAPVDAMARSGLLAALYERQQPPFVPGMEIAGTVEVLGIGVSDGELSAGTPVAAFVDFKGAHGGYSELLALPAESVVRAPAGLSMPEAATTVLNPLTARNALDALDLPAGATLLVTGAAGAVGGYLVQLAAHAGLRVVAHDPQARMRVVAQASAGNEKLVRDLGAAWFVPRDADLAQAVKAQLPDGVDAVVDTANIGVAVADAVRDGGQYAALRPSTDETGRGIAVKGLNVRQRATDHAAIAALRDLFDQGVLTARLGEVVPARDAARAHELLETGGLRGRIALDLTAF